MSTNDVTGYAQAYAPWRRGIAWWVVLIQALIALAVGIYAILNPESAAWVIITGFCLYFVIAALRTIWQALRGRDIGFSVLGLLAAGGGLTIGMAVLVPAIRSWFFDLEATPEMKASLFYVFGLGMLIIGLLSTGSAFVERPEHGIRWASVIRGVIFVMLGIYLLYALRNLESIDDSLVLTVLSWGFVIIGILLVLQSIVLYRNSRPEVEPAPATTTPAA
jgi:hypothetical protein